jgi:hypothetical protein
MVSADLDTEELVGWSDTGSDDDETKPKNQFAMNHKNLRLRQTIIYPWILISSKLQVKSALNQILEVN